MELPYLPEQALQGRSLYVRDSNYNNGASSAEEAMAFALREDRMKLWRDLWAKAAAFDETVEITMGIIERLETLAPSIPDHNQRNDFRRRIRRSKRRINQMVEDSGAFAHR